MHQLREMWIENVMSGITESDAFYQETKQRIGIHSNKLDALQLSKETKPLIDQYASEHIANGSRYGELAYQLGFSDCAELLLGIHILRSEPLLDVTWEKDLHEALFLVLSFICFIFIIIKSKIRGFAEKYGFVRLYGGFAKWYHFCQIV